MQPHANLLTLTMPMDLQQRIGIIAEEQAISVHQLALYILTKEIGNLEAGHTLSTYWKDIAPADIMAGFDDVMSKVPVRPVPEWDRIA